MGTLRGRKTSSAGRSTATSAAVASPWVASDRLEPEEGTPSRAVELPLGTVRDAEPARRPLSGSVIVIARREVAARIACLIGDVDVIGFHNLHELDRWRRGELLRDDTIRGDVGQALFELGTPMHLLSNRMRVAIETLCQEKVVPGVTCLEGIWPSRRSFYRAWARELPLAPSVFLRRVRTLRAERLMEEGATAREAAIRTGFASVDRLRRLIAERRATAPTD